VNPVEFAYDCDPMPTLAAAIGVPLRSLNPTPASTADADAMTAFWLHSVRLAKVRQRKAVRRARYQRQFQRGRP
jgi:hypothetical protein